MLLACILLYFGTELQNSGSWCSSLELGEATCQKEIDFTGVMHLIECL